MFVPDCRKRVLETTSPPYNLTDDQLFTMLCALGTEKGPCKGDVGGPYSFVNNTQHVLVTFDIIFIIS